MKKRKFETEQKVNDVLRAVESELREIFKDKLKKLILFGSYCRGDFDSESDIDVMALVDDPTPRKYDDVLLDVEVDLSIAYDTVLSIFVESETEYREARKYKPFLKSIEGEGIEIFRETQYVR
ncbi:MAG: nucleotidyltransferase domain-containing protein [bacterium]|nr:nucleotidyltransferase domain-containing protein [bacterium]